jgi:hypothetical protein
MKKATILNRMMWLLILLLNVTVSNAQTFNLQTVQPTTIPSGMTLEWYNAKPFTAATKVTNITAVTPGVYYAVYNNGSCLSNPTPFKLVKTDCGSATTNLYAAVDSTNKPGGTKVVFNTAKPVSSANAYTGDPTMAYAGTYYVSYYDAVKDCYTATSTIVVINDLVCFYLVPDFNATTVNVTVKGNVATNDVGVATSTFGSPVALAGNPNTNLPVINADGTYSFVSNLPGVYQFSVSVCRAGQTNCPTELLTITVTDRLDPVSPPIANPDISTTKTGVAVVIPVKTNDHATSPYGALGIPSISEDPSNGATTVNADGTVTYTPNPGFAGVDTFRYQVCDTVELPSMCAKTYVIVTVVPDGYVNTTFGADDYNSTTSAIPVSGNVLINDSDPEGNTQTVTPFTTTDSTGTFTLVANGAYTFTSVPNFIGTVNYPYTVCDNGTPQACAHATVHILVTKGPDYTLSILVDNPIYTNTDTSRDFVMAVYNVNNTLNKGAVQFKILQQLPNKRVASDPAQTTSTFNGGFAVQNNQWNITTQGSFYVFTLKPGVIIPPNGALFVGFQVIEPSTAPVGPQNLSSTITYQSGGDSNISNNSTSIRLTKNN